MKPVSRRPAANSGSAMMRSSTGMVLRTPVMLVLAQRAPPSARWPPRDRAPQTMSLAMSVS